MNNETSVSIKFTNKIDNEKQLERYAEKLKTINSILNAMDAGKAKAVDSISKTLGNENAKNEVKNLNNAMDVAFNTAKITAFITSVKNLTKTISGYTNKSATYLENMNLLDVAFGDNTNEAKKFINTLSEMYGLDESWGTRTVGIFKQLANAMGLADEVGTKMSKTLTQLAIDTSSLYNIDVEDTVSILQSALAGQTKPSRRLGADITQSTLQLTLDSAGIDRAIESLTYAEKRLVIVASLLNQTQLASNDWGRTIESVANQMRIFQQQTERLTRALGNVFLPILKAILPFLNGFLMALTEVISWLAILVGFKEEDFDFFGGTSDAVVDLSDDLASASENAKKLKSGLRGFDKLNNISSSSSAGSAGNVSGGVDPEVLDLFNKASDSYMSSLEKVEMKATKIRDRIMEWLGFTKQINNETDDISFTFEHITGGTVLGALVVGGTIYSGVVAISKVLSKLGIISKPLPTTFTLISNAIKGFSSATGLTGAFQSIGIAISGWAKGAWSFSEAMTVVGLALGTVALVATGVAVAVAGLKLAFEGINTILEGDTFKGIMEIISGVALVVSGVALAFGAWPVAIGGAVVAGIALIVAFWDEISKFFTNIWEWININLLQPIVDFLTPLAQWIYDKVIKPIIDFFAPIFDAVASIFTAIVTNITDIVVGVGKAVWSIISKVGEIFLKIVEIFVALGVAGYKYIIKPIFDFIGSIAIWVWDNAIKPIIDFFVGVGTWVYNKIIKPVWDKVVWLKDKAVAIFKTIGTTVVNFIGGLVKSVINGVLSAIEETINGFIKMLNSAIKIINKIPGVDIKKVTLLSIPRLKTGLDFVPRDYYPAYLDYGERVLTKEQNADYNKGIINGQVANNGRPINATFVIQVGNKEIAKQVINDLQDIAKDNGKPITIGG